jgi:hypothetical protein
MSLLTFLQEDTPRTLFPLEGPRLVIERGASEISNFVDQEIFSTAEVHPHFAQAPIAFALKGPLETRRVHVLDPIATFYLYGFVYQHTGCFRQPTKSLPKRRYGYHFKDKLPVNAAEEHQRFRSRIIDLKQNHKYIGKVDIANCFSAFYHHDVVSVLKAYVGEEKARRFGVFLREINAGRSVSCFPQGYFPTKAIGNLYLSFVEENADLRSPAIVRYLDDIYLFADSRRRIEADIYRIQTMLSAHNLYLNASKTIVETSKSSMRLPRTNAIRKSLLAKRAEAIETAYDERPEDVHLTDDEFGYLSSVISAKDVAEEDVELALALITEDEAHAERLAELVFRRYPHLIKSLYTHLSSAAFDGPTLFKLIEHAVADRSAHEFVLFWCARILLAMYKWNRAIAQLIMTIHNHVNASNVVKALILESAHLDFGMADQKENALQNAGSSIVAVAAAVGLRDLEHGKRNQLYKYAAASSPLMYQVTSALQKAAPTGP